MRLKTEGWSVILRAIALTAALAAWIGCGGSSDSSNRTGNRTDARTETPETIVVATDATYRPFEFYNEERELVGFDIDLFRAVGAAAGFEAEFVHQSFDGALAGLTTGKYDALISAMTITEERKQTFLFSDPYYDAGQAVAVRVTETAIGSFEDLGGKTIGAQRGTTGFFKAQEVPDAKILEYDTIELAFTALQNGSVDAVINDEPTSRSIAAARGGIKIVGETLTDEQYGIAFPKESEALAERVNSALKQLKDDGTIEQLRRKWIDAPL